MFTLTKRIIAFKLTTNFASIQNQILILPIKLWNNGKKNCLREWKTREDIIIFFTVYAVCNGPNEALLNEFDLCVAIPKCKNLVFIYPLFIKKHITYFSVVLCPKGLILRHLILCIQRHELRFKEKQNSVKKLFWDILRLEF